MMNTNFDKHRSNTATWSLASWAWDVAFPYIQSEEASRKMPSSGESREAITRCTNYSYWLVVVLPALTKWSRHSIPNPHAERLIYYDRRGG